MCLILEISMLIFGIVTLITGKFSLSRTKVIQGGVARIVGGIMVLPLPLAFGAGVIIGVAMGASGKAPDIDKIRLVATIMEASIVVICFVVAMIIAAVNAGPPPKPRRPRRGRDEYEEDYDREEADRTEDDEDRPRGDDRIRRPRDDRSRE
jgi:hypothetical protein